MTNNNKVIDELIEKQMCLTKNKQMTEEEYRYIASFLSDKNFLVFGTGYDSDLWRQANKNGKTIFLEHNAQWITNFQDTYRIVYTSNLRRDKHTLLEQYKQGDYSRLEIDMPEEVKNTAWDVILVDSPEGGKKKHYHGRMQSIYAAKKLAHDNTDILIHDCDRYIEDTYSSEMFNTFITQLTKLRHYRK